MPEDVRNTKLNKLIYEVKNTLISPILHFPGILKIFLSVAYCLQEKIFAFFHLKKSNLALLRVRSVNKNSSEMRKPKSCSNIPKVILFRTHGLKYLVLGLVKPFHM